MPTLTCQDKPVIAMIVIHVRHLTLKIVAKCHFNKMFVVIQIRRFNELYLR